MSTRLAHFNGYLFELSGSHGNAKMAVYRGLANPEPIAEEIDLPIEARGVCGITFDFAGSLLYLGNGLTRTILAVEVPELLCGRAGVDALIRSDIGFESLTIERSGEREFLALLSGGRDVTLYDLERARASQRLRYAVSARFQVPLFTRSLCGDGQGQIKSLRTTAHNATEVASFGMATALGIGRNQHHLSPPTVPSRVKFVPEWQSDMLRTEPGRVCTVGLRRSRNRLITSLAVRPI